MAEPKFTVLFEKLRGQTFELNKETMSIGRRDGMDICIKDSSMSGHHADLICTVRDGKKIGTHQGAHFYTIGQRKGLNIGGHKDSIFVIETDVPRNIIYVGEGHTHKGLSRSCLRILSRRTLHSATGCFLCSTQEQAASTVLA